MENKYDIGDLRQRQSLSLRSKILLTKKRLREWFEYWNGNVYVNFSGGKDSTVLLHIVRQLYPNIPAVFVDTGLEFPEIKSHVKSFQNVEIIRPEKNFKQVIIEDGWVFPSKDVAMTLFYAKKGSLWAINRLKGYNKDGSFSQFKKDRYEKYGNFVNAPFQISHRCCIEMKEKPLAKYQSKRKLHPIIGILAEESYRRTQSWLKTGCNAYNAKTPSSKPLAIWTEQDILHYIKEYDVKISSVYGDIVESSGKLKCTAEDRTGCMFCLVGCHLEKGDKRRFVRMKETHPQIYKYCMEQLRMKEILDYIHNACNCQEPLY